ncbi:hypothetical protein HJ590_12290 [Naumannella sp. ID2617S]|nr:hypothetical protein [Naumannella sp. ID2617S]
MNVVVRYRKQASGIARRIIGVALLVPGLFLFWLGIAHPLLRIQGGLAALPGQVLKPPLDLILPSLLGLLLIAGGVLALTLRSPLARSSAPNGVAWVLEPLGVMVPLPGREARIPWHQVRFQRTQVAGGPGVRCTGPGVDVAYPEAGLSLNHQQLDVEARRISCDHR